MTPEFSRPIRVSRLSVVPSHHPIEATEAERAALATRFGIPAILRLTADCMLTRDRRGTVTLSVTLEASIVQECVVTLDPVSASIAEPFTVIYQPGLDDAAADRLVLEAPDDVVIEPLATETIDIGEAAAQHLSIAMDPYPRAVEKFVEH